MITKKFIKKRQQYKVTFELPADIEADEIYLLADFNGWEEVPLERQKSGKWKLICELAPDSSYQFRYRVLRGNYEEYQNDPMADGFVANALGTENSLITCSNSSES
jgi:1,4-alpha-glucan branching enzyme